MVISGGLIVLGLSNVLLMLWLNKYSMHFPDDVLDLLIEACLRAQDRVR